MTDQAPPQPPTGAAQQPPQMQILAQYIKDLSFENPNAPAVFTEQGKAPPEIKVGVDVKTAAAGDGRYEVVLNLKGEGKREDKTTFLVELSYGALVQIDAAIPRDQVRLILLVQVPTMIFPAARNVIADATRDGGFPPLLVQPVDFVTMFRRQMEALLAQQQQNAAAPAAGPVSDPPAGNA